MRIDLLRHGECLDGFVWLRGRTDSELSEKGWAQMTQQVANLTFAQNYQMVISSPAKRCAEFTKQACLNSLLPSNNPKIEQAWQECDFGLFDGLTFEQVKANYPVELGAYLQDPFNYTIPQAEGFKVFQARIQQAWVALIESAHVLNNVSSDDSILVISHGGPIRLVLQQVLGLSDNSLFNIDISYGSRVSIEVVMPEPSNGSRGQPFCKLIEVVQSIPEEMYEKQLVKMSRNL